MEETIKYFESLDDAERFIKAHNIRFFRYKTSRRWGNLLALIIEKTFICEICKEETPTKCEGSEPNTCAMCMPLLEGEI